MKHFFKHSQTCNHKEKSRLLNYIASRDFIIHVFEPREDTTLTTIVSSCIVHIEIYINLVEVKKTRC